MSVWSEGYVGDIDYTAAYFPELNPLRAKLAFLNAGLVFPKVRTACELGFGHGVSVNLHAAGTATRWFGNDFTPAQAARAQAMAQAAGSHAELTDESFAQLAERTDLPTFDFIALHGIWSWVSPANRGHIVDFIRRQLAPGGVVYISYNTLPGWAHLAPMQRLLKEHAATMGSAAQGSVGRAEAALAFVEKFLAVPTNYRAVTPQAGQWLEDLKTKNRVYMAHEYLNEHWTPMYFSDAAAELAPAKLAFGCSATLLDQVYPLNLTAEQMGLLAGIADVHQRESMLDFVMNQQFRRDYWVKGVRRLSATEQLEGLRNLRLVLLTPADQVPLKVSGRLGEARLNEGVYRPLLAALADHQPKSFGTIERELAGRNIDLAKLVQALVVLTHENHLAAAQEDDEIEAARATTDRLNAYVLEQARSNLPMTSLASPVTGGGIRLPWHHQLFLLARRKGLASPDQWAQFAWEHFASVGHQMSRDGKTLEKPDDNLAELRRLAKALAEKGLGPMEAWQVV